MTYYETRIRELRAAGAEPRELGLEIAIVGDIILVGGDSPAAYEGAEGLRRPSRTARALSTGRSWPGTASVRSPGESLVPPTGERRGT